MIIISNILIWQPGTQPSVLFCTVRWSYFDWQTAFAQVASSNIVITVKNKRKPRHHARDVYPAPLRSSNLALAQLEVFNSSLRNCYRVCPNLQRAPNIKVDPSGAHLYDWFGTLWGEKKIKYSRILNSHRKRTDLRWIIESSRVKVADLILDLSSWRKENQTASRSWLLEIKTK